MAPFTNLPQSKAFQDYYAAMREFQARGISRELSIRQAFSTLLTTLGKQVNWFFVPEEPLPNRKRPDGTLLDSFNIPRGYWEAKDTNDSLEAEIAKKKALGYPLTNIIFEDSRRGILYQNGKQVLSVTLSEPTELALLLTRFFTHVEQPIEEFHKAVREFQDRIPHLAVGLMKHIAAERQNPTFMVAFDRFTTICCETINPIITADMIQEMLVQHLLTERLFRTVFNNPDFVKRNGIAQEIELVIDALTNEAFSRGEFLKSLDYFYQTIEAVAKDIHDFSEKQTFLNTVYERFFQSFSQKQADTHGIVYTPQAIVDFMCASVEDLLQKEFAKDLASSDVQILDPCVGTGNFIVNLLQRIPHQHLRRKYEQEIFCNEVLLLPYYIAALNIEHAYYALMQSYRPFPGICFVDTLDLADKAALVDDQQGILFPDAMLTNKERVERQKAAPITVIIGNPPYNVGQKSENDNNRNRKYPVIEQRIRKTYAQDSRASNKNALSDAYVKFFRWAIDRLEDRDGIVCFVSNNGFFNGIAFDGFRKHLIQDFTEIYHFDFAGNARTSGEQRRKEGGNIFRDQIRTGVGITILIRNRQRQQAQKQAKVWYHRVGDYLTAEQKKEYLLTFKAASEVPWQPLIIDANHNWLIGGLATDFATFLPLGTKEAKAARDIEVETIFKTYSNGISTNRDHWMYDFDAQKLAYKANSMLQTYNAELARWLQAGCPSDIDAFVLADAKKIKWSSRLKECFARKIRGSFDLQAIRRSLYRPFTCQYLYFDPLMTHRRGLFPEIFPTPASETENLVICLSGLGSSKPFHCLVSNAIPCLDMIEKAQCFPFYTYAEDGSNRQENITDWAVNQFEAHYGPDLLVAGFRQAQPPLNRGVGGPGTERAEGKVSANSTSAWPVPELAEGNGSKKAIFFYIYALLHHPLYRERYQENLKRDLPHIPLVGQRQTFLALVTIGQKLADLHLNYEAAEEYPLEWVENKQVPWSWRVEKMKLTKEQDAIIVNHSLTLKGIPALAFEYQLGSRSALEWIIDQYQITTDKQSGLTNDPNREDDPEYIARLIGKVITVSVETVKLVAQLAQFAFGKA